MLQALSGVQAACLAVQDVGLKILAQRPRQKAESLRSLRRLQSWQDETPSLQDHVATVLSRREALATAILASSESDSPDAIRELASLHSLGEKRVAALRRGQEHPAVPAIQGHEPPEGEIAGA